MQGTKDCPPYRYFNNPSKLWRNAFNAEEKYSPNKDAIVATKFEVSIPEGLTFIEANNALKNLTEGTFAKNGHVAQYYLLSNSNNSSSMKGVIVVADRRTKKGDFVEEKKVLIKKGKDKEEKKASLLYGVDGRLAVTRVKLGWIDALNSIVSERDARKVKFISRSRVDDFLDYIDHKKKEFGKRFKKDMVNMRKFARFAWNKNLKDKKYNNTGMNLDENTR